MGDGRESDAGKRMGARFAARVLPGVDEEAVEAADGRKEQRGWQQDASEREVARNSWDEDGGREEDADSDLFW